MNMLVDTSVWIDFFNGTSNALVDRLETALIEEDSIRTCGIVLMEIFQGIRSETELQRVKQCFDELPCLPMERAVFEEAARMYRTLRHQGITIRKPIDCLIAAVALHHDVALLHNDRDFLPLAQHFGVRLCELKGL